MWVLYALLAALTAALMTITAKIGLAKTDSILATAIRSTVMLLLTGGAVLALNKQKLIGTLDGSAFIAIVVAGIFGALSWLFYFLALQSGTASKVAALDRLSVVFIVLLAAIFLSERLTIPSVIGALLIVSGAMLMVFAP